MEFQASVSLSAIISVSLEVAWQASRAHIILQLVPLNVLARI